MTDTASPRLSQQEWLDRYKAQFVKRGCLPELAESASRAETFDVLSEDYEDDPEGSADMEMSYWDE